MELRITLPLAPSLNNAYWTDEEGKRHLTKAGRQFKRDATLLARNAAALAGWEYPPGGRVVVGMRLWFGSKRSNAASDIDNRYKLAGDAVAKALGYNDNHVDRIVVDRAGVDPGQARSEVTVILRPPVSPAARSAPQRRAA